MAKYMLCGDTRSCGCDQRASRARGHVKHGGYLNGVKKREYAIWRSMKSRCYIRSSSGYRFYGGKGVTVCDRWRNDFAAFMEDMGSCPEGLTLDRIDPRGNYEPHNCRWETWETQRKNLRSHHAALLI